MTSKENILFFNSYIKELCAKGLIYKGQYSSSKELPKYLSTGGDVITIKDKEYICTAPNHLEPLL